MKKIINSIFMFLVISTNLAYLPQAIISIINRVPLISSINYSYEYITLGLKNDFPIIRYSKDIFVILLFILIIVDILKRKRCFKLSIIMLSVTTMILIPISIISLNYSNEFSISMIIAGIRVVIFPITLILYSMEYLDYTNTKKFYNILKKLIRFEFIIVVLQSFIIAISYGTINIAKYRAIGTFASSGLLGLFGIGAITFIIIYKCKVDNQIGIIPSAVFTAFIVFASGTRTAMVLYAMTIFSYIFHVKINRKNNIKATNLFVIISTVVGIAILNLAELVAERGNAISAQFDNGRITFIVEHIKNSSLKEVLFGKGLGYGTNTALSMISEMKINTDSTTRVMDGTINILITQFGIIITFIIIMCYLCVVINIFKASLQQEIKITFVLTSIILIVVGNVLEQFSFQLLFVVNNCIIVKMFTEIKENIYAKKNTV